MVEDRALSTFIERLEDAIRINEGTTELYYLSNPQFSTEFLKLEEAHPQVFYGRQSTSCFT